MVTYLVLRPAFAASVPAEVQTAGARRGLDARRRGRARSARVTARAAVAARLARMIDVALLAAAFGAVLLVLLQLALLADLRGTGVTASVLTGLLTTHAGQAYLARIPLLAALAIVLRGRVAELALRGAGDGAPSPPAFWLRSWLALAGALLATVSIAGHAVTAPAAALVVLSDLVHLAAGAVWISGVAVLALVLPAARRAQRAEEHAAVITHAVRTFSRLAVVAIGLVVGTGLLNGVADVGAPADLRFTGYGQALLVKLWVFLWVLGLGAFNHVILRRRLERTGEDPRRVQRVLAKTVSAELAFGVLVFAATALLVGLPKTR